MAKNQRISMYLKQKQICLSLIALILSGAGVNLLAAPATAQTSPVPANSVADPESNPLLLVPRVARPNLTTDSKGEAVTELQAMLKLLGFYSGPVTGIYGELTQAAVQRFQVTVGLTPDGIVGPATWSRLLPTPENESLPPTALTTDTSSQSSEAATVSSRTTEKPTATAAVTTNRPLLRFGMEGNEVTRLQQRLKTLGFYQGTIDSIFGTQTEQAVRAAQEHYELMPDGIVGPATWSALEL